MKIYDAPATHLRCIFERDCTLSRLWPLVTRLHRELVRAVEKPKTREVFATQGAQPATMTSANFARRIDSEIRQWRDLVARVGIKVE